MNEIILRPYQQDATDKAMKSLKEGNNPVIGLVTGGGKSIIMCSLSEEIINWMPTANILILSHVKEILEQNHSALEDYFPGINIGLYSAGLNSRTIHKITVASIQTAHRNIEKFQDFDFVLVDECHRVGDGKNSIYNKFLMEVGLQHVGLSATPYRTKGGWLHEQENGIFDDLAYDCTRGEEFTNMIDEGYLCPIFSKNTALKLDTTGVRTTGGDFNQKDLSEKLDRDHITEAAIIETVFFGKNYSNWLVFAIDIEHAENIKIALERRDISTCIVHSKMDDDRDTVIRDYKNGKYRCLINVDILIAGFDNKAIDLIVMLRPTQSPIIHVQAPGRGLRPLYADGYNLGTAEGRLAAIAASSKPHCLVLDYARNCERLGMINDPIISKKRKKKGKGEAITKVCKECDFINHGNARECCNCGEPFSIREQITLEASTSEIISRKEDKKKKEWIPPEWVRVDKVIYESGRSKKAGEFVRVVYHCGISVYSEVVCLEGVGFAKHQANNWIKHRWTDQHLPVPTTSKELLDHRNLVLKPKKILVDPNGNGKHVSIKNSEL